MNQIDNRLVVVFAGPNGSGKSTITEALIESNPDWKTFTYTNADEIMKNGNFNNPSLPSFSGEEKQALIASAEADFVRLGIIPTEKEHANMIAAKIVDSVRKKAISSGKSYIMETVASTPRILDTIAMAKESGYSVDVIYVTTQDKEINVKRVAARTLDGGHDVPVDKIRSRYDSAMKLMPQIVDASDTANVFDNSFAKGEFSLIAEKENDVITVFPIEDKPGSTWTKEKLLEFFPNAKLKEKTSVLETTINEAPPKGIGTQAVNHAVSQANAITSPVKDIGVVK